MRTDYKKSAANDGDQRGAILAKHSLSFYTVFIHVIQCSFCWKRQALRLYTTCLYSLFLFTRIKEKSYV